MSWPGLSVRSDAMKVDPKALTEAADILERELRRLTGDGMGTRTHLATEATIPPQMNWFGRWQTALDMEYGYNTARDSILFYYDELVSQLTNAVTLLRTTAADHQGTDEASRAALDSQTAALEAARGPSGGGGAAPTVVA